MTTNDKIEIMKAYLTGMKIQERKVSISDEPWKDVDYEPIWDWYKKEYRIKPVWDWYKKEYRTKPKKEENLKLMTNRQLSEWLAKGNGQFCYKDEFGYINNHHSYKSYERNGVVDEDILICSWGSDKWIKPTLEIYERDCKEKK